MLEIYHRPSLPQKMENHDKLHELSFMFFRISIHNLLNHRSLPMKCNICTFILNMLDNVADVILTNSHPWTHWSCVPTNYMFLQSMEFRIQKFLSATSLEILHLTQVIFLLRPIIASAHGSLIAQTSCNTQLNSHYFFRIFLVGGI